MCHTLFFYYRFLQHLIAHFLKVANTNSFENFVLEDVRMCRIYETISFFNHSCAPNILSYMEGPTIRLMACRSIAKNEQLFISYIPFGVEELRQMRRKNLLDGWGISCRCLRCTSPDITEWDMNRASKLTVAKLRATLRKATEWSIHIGACTIVYNEKIQSLLFSKI